MGFKDLPGGSNAGQGQSATDKTASPKAAPSNSDVLQKQESLTNTKSS